MRGLPLQVVETKKGEGNCPLPWKSVEGLLRFRSRFLLSSLLAPGLRRFHLRGWRGYFLGRIGSGSEAGEDNRPQPPGANYQGEEKADAKRGGGDEGEEEDSQEDTGQGLLS